MAGELRNGEEWHPARLIPTAGIRGQDEQERRATSSLLAGMMAVPDFGRAILSDLGAPSGRISTFAEVQLKNPDGKLSIPDGAIVVERGKTRWRCLLEVKTGWGAVEARAGVALSRPGAPARLPGGPDNPQPDHRQRSGEPR